MSSQIIINPKRGGGGSLAAGSAVNGLTVSATGKVVLGQNDGEAGDPGILLSNRQIPLSNFSLIFTGAVGQTSDCWIYKLSGGGTGANLKASGELNITKKLSFNDSALLFVGNVLSDDYLTLEAGTTKGVKFRDSAGTIKAKIEFNGASDARTDFDGTIRTNNIVTGATTAQYWKLGNTKAQAVVFDATQYVEVEIAGVIIKLAIAV